ncbi:MAG: P22 coat protein [Oscillospiraceae bacterium]|nr:P22 coat protein [Oscillospiraceae bacterium]
MANTFLTPEIVAKEALMCLQSNLVMADLVHRDYSDEFVSVGDTVSIRKPAKFVAKNFTGTTSAQDITEGSVPVKLDRFRDITVAVDAKQLSLDIADFSRQVVEPAMQAIAQAIDEDLLAVGIQGAGYVRAGTENAADLADIADLAKKLDMNKVPTANRSLVLCPEHKYRYALTDNLSKVAYAGDSLALRDALLGRVYTLDTYMDQNAPGSNAQTPGTATAFTVSGTAGESVVTVEGADGTVAAGDGFILGGYLYRFTAGGSGELTIDQPLMESVEGAAAAVVNAPMSLAFHRNGLALVTRKLALPMGAAKAAYASAGGLGVRVVYDYDAATKTDKVSFDIIYGIRALDESMICALKG